MDSVFGELGCVVVRKKDKPLLETKLNVQVVAMDTMFIGTAVPALMVPLVISLK
jgi:hypothetical protein